MSVDAAPNHQSPPSVAGVATVWRGVFVSLVEVIKLAIHPTAELEDSLARFAKRQRILSVGGLEIGEKQRC